MNTCEHIRHQSKDGEDGLWCIDCGVKIYDVETRECQFCTHYFNSVGYKGCKKHLMAVTPTMLVTFKVEQGTCFRNKLEQGE